MILDQLLVHMRHIYHRLLFKFLHYQYRVSFSQSGEDAVIDSLFTVLNKRFPTYLDIGTNHPANFNNTYLFYRKGCHGVCIEPDPSLCRTIKKYRPRDICINAGISDTDATSAIFYMLSTHTLNTFSAEEAEKYTKNGQHSIINKINIPLLTVNSVIRDNFTGAPDLVSIDVEGWEMKILETFDFQSYRPTVFCIETLTYSSPGNEKKLTNIIDFLEARGYIRFADTYINSIFIDKATWESRKPC